MHQTSRSRLALRAFMAITGLAALSAPALAQPDIALVVMSLEGPGGLPVSTVQPGQTVHVRTTISWTLPGTQFGGIAGRFEANNTTGFLPGSVANLTTQVPAPSAQIWIGQIINGDDILGFKINTFPPFFNGGVIVPPLGNYTGFSLYEYDWTAPTEPGVHTFEFIVETFPSGPHTQVFTSLTQTTSVLLPTTSIGTAITVLPAPASALSLAGLCFAGRRRRA